ncbi:hypothetical protein GCM10009601_07430 [Streptomyces thermospinosisporus]|uniref:Transposase n=1 Tax=Streptomyces thermospinosisporus TaxID=161482 RepID=A0ABN1YK07_9ACTN
MTRSVDIEAAPSGCQVRFIAPDCPQEKGVERPVYRLLRSSPAVAARPAIAGVRPALRTPRTLQADTSKVVRRAFASASAVRTGVGTRMPQSVHTGPADGS